MNPSIPKPLKILVIDDDKTLIREIESQLVRAGFLVTTAVDGASGLNIFEMEKFDLILVDLVMPGLTGFEVVKDIRHRNPTVPIAVLSLLGQQEDVNHAMEVGASKYFAKKTPMFLDDVVHYAEELSVK